MTKQPTRILYVHNSTDIYGASRSLTRQLDGLDRRQFQASVVLPSKGPLKQQIEELGVNVFVHPELAIVDRYANRLQLFCYRFPKSVWWLWRLIRRERIDLVHTNTAVIFSPGLAAKLAFVPHVWHVRESFDEFPSALWKVYSAYMRMVSNKIVTVSNPIATQFPNGPKLVVVHNGFLLNEFDVDQPQLRKQFREQFNIHETEFVAACIGRIKWKRKGQEFLIRAAARLQAQGRFIKVLLVGEPWPGNEDHLARLRALARELNLPDRIIFAGELPDARPAHAASDVLVLPSAQPEPFAGVVMEAMAMGKPVIATAVGGSLDQVADGETGYLVPPADPEALAEKISLLIGDADLRTRMGLAGIRRIQTNFNLEQMIKTIEGIYNELLAQ